MKKLLVKVLLIVLTASLFSSCIHEEDEERAGFWSDLKWGGEDVYITTKQYDQLIGTWELTERRIYDGNTDNTTKVYPGTIQYATELTYFHDFEYQNLYDNARYDQGSWKVVANNRVQMKSTSRGVQWGPVNVTMLTKSRLCIVYVAKGDISLFYDNLIATGASYLSCAKGLDWQVYYDEYKRIEKE